VAQDIPELGSLENYVPPAVQHLTAETLRVYEAPEADQGVAVDDEFFYPVDNSTIGKYRRDTGELVDRFMTAPRGLLRHMNSCYARDEQLWCANSNYSLTPMSSSMEVFDAETMEHSHSWSLGLMEEGSLTWFDDFGSDRIAGFAHYSGNGGLDYKASEFSGVVVFDNEWRRKGGWQMPASVIERMAPYAASGGAIGPDGLLYLLGHDLPEMYVVARPTMGPVLVHVATIALEAEGQAFSFVPNNSGEIFAIDRRFGLVRHIALPAIGELPNEAMPFN
ncbi:MAG TPA: hypothetical protein DDZ43_04875, partial [Hyphomonadaceae bacterium]|nr:hypothetical protein [Hyphomonadaceae bacterium]